MNTHDTLLDWALRYARLGWPVFPANGKEPNGILAPNGSHSATTNEATIRDWWRRAPRANIALATNARFFVLDVDTKNNGDAELELLEQEHGKLPETLVQITGTKGKHHLFVVPADFTVRNSQSLIANGIDIRGAGGYIIAAPSVHPETGTEYSWDGLAEIEDQPIAAAPEWLLDKLRQQVRSGVAPSVVGEKIPKGKQHAQLVSIAGSMRARGLEFDEILATLTITNAKRCEEPGPEKNIRKIAESVCRYPAGRLVRDYIQLFTAEQSPEPELDVTTLPDWGSMLISSDRGKALPNVHNAVLPLLYDPAFHRALAYDTLRQQITILRPLPFEETAPCQWADKHDIAYAVWCQSNGINCPTNVANQAAQLAGMRHSFHPVRDYLDSLVWDGTQRISQWLTTYLGVEYTQFTSAVGAKWLVSAVARAKQPGCKADCCLILEGKQGIRKSSALRVLGDPWFTDDVGDLTSKDSAQQVGRAWIVELAELHAVNRAEVTALKSFLARAVDQYRPAYGRHVTQTPRSCVFAGTTNRDNYLRDETGARRFWPVSCEFVDIEGLERDRDQIWAEAVQWYLDGREWWLTDEATIATAESETIDRCEEDTWLEDIRDWASSRQAEFSVRDVLQKCLEIPIGKWSHSDKVRVGQCLNVIGYKPKRKRVGGVITKVYEPKGGQG